MSDARHRDDTEPMGRTTVPDAPDDTARDGASATPAPPARAAVPKQFAHYQVFSLLGSGGMARVYRAFDAKLDRLVALKVLATSDAEGAEAQEQQRRRLVREARAAAALKHPNVVAIYEVGEDQGLPFIAMELVEGRGLRASVEGAPVETRLRWLLEAARALEAAHAAGLVHRDVKPENMVVDERGVLRLLDFGIAKRREDEVLGTFDAAGGEGPSSLRTTAGRRIGTPRYMAPEQLAGLPSDERTDQYAWGLVAFEVMTGAGVKRDLGDGSLAHGALEPLESSKVAPRLAEVIRRALSRDQAGRFRSMTDLLAELGSAPDRSEIATATATSTHAAPSPSVLKPAPSGGALRSRLVAVGVAGALALASAAALVVTRKAQRGPHSRCMVTTSENLAPFAPPSLLVLSNGRALLGVYPPKSEGGPASGLEVFSLANRQRSDIVVQAGVEPSVVRKGEIHVAPVSASPRSLALVARFDESWAPHPNRGRTSLTAFEAGGGLAGTTTVSFVPSAVAAVEEEKGEVLVAMTGFEELVDPNNNLLRKSTDPYLVALTTLRSPMVFAKAYEGPTPLSDVAVASRPGMRAIAFLEGDAVSLLRIDASMGAVGTKVSFARRGVSGPPAVAFAGETLFVAFSQRTSGTTRLVVEAERGGAPFAPVKEIDDDTVVRDSPRLVPLASGGALLLWISSSPSGNRLRGARLEAVASVTFDVAGANAKQLTTNTREQGALVGWIDARDGAAHATTVTCLP